jgi:hypothetical protein
MMEALGALLLYRRQYPTASYEVWPSESQLRGPVMLVSLDISRWNEAVNWH